MKMWLGFEAILVLVMLEIWLHNIWTSWWLQLKDPHTIGRIWVQLGNPYIWLYVYVFILYTYTFLPCKHGKSLVIYVGETMPMPMPSVMYFCSVETIINHCGNAQKSHPVWSHGIWVVFYYSCSSAAKVVVKDWVKPEDGPQHLGHQFTVCLKSFKDQILQGYSNHSNHPALGSTIKVWIRAHAHSLLARNKAQ